MIGATLWLALLGLGLAADEPEVVDAEAAEATEAPEPTIKPLTPGVTTLWRSKDGEAALETWGHLRGLWSVPSKVVVDADGTETGQGLVLDTRVRAGLGFRFSGLNVATEWDLLTGQASGDAWDIPGTVDARRRDTFTTGTLEGVTPRRASVEANIGRTVRVEAGLMPANTWGLGLLASGGTREPLFGRLDRGDRMLRLLVSFAPFTHGGDPVPLSISVGFDRVVEDELARWSDGQEAYHLLGAVLWNDPEGRRAGMFYTYLTQTEPGDDPRPTKAHVIDLYGEIPVDIGDSGWRFHAGVEGAVIAGSTERVLTYGNLQTSELLSGGAVAELAFHSPHDRFSFHLNAGFGSASGDPDAGVLQDFTFDRNYKVGLVLFDEVLGAIDAGTYNLLDDRTTSGSTPLGAEMLVREGAIGRSAYLQKAFTVRPTDWIRLRFGAVAAWSTDPIANPFYTFRAGGEPHNHLNQPTQGRYLATELDGQLMLAPPESVCEHWPMRPQLGVEGGVAFLSEDLGGGRQALARMKIQADW